MREEAKADAKERERNLTDTARRKLRDIMRLLTKRKRVKRRRKRARDEEVERREKESKEKTGKGLTRRALEKVGEEIAAQFEAEIREIERQLATEKKELAKMIRDGKK